MKLRDYLTSQGITPAQFAAQIGVNQVSVTRYLAGTRRPVWTVISRIVKVTDGRVTANDFMAEGRKTQRRSRGNGSRPPSEAAAAA